MGGLWTIQWCGILARWHIIMAKSIINSEPVSCELFAIRWELMATKWTGNRNGNGNGNMARTLLDLWPGIFLQVDESACNSRPDPSQILGFHFVVYWHPSQPSPDQSIHMLTRIRIPNPNPNPDPFLPKEGETSVGGVVRSAECIPRVQLANCTGNVAGNGLVTASWQTGVKAVSAPLWPLNFVAARRCTLPEKMETVQLYEIIIEIPFNSIIKYRNIGTGTIVNYENISNWKRINVFLNST